MKVFYLFFLALLSPLKGLWAQYPPTFPQNGVYDEREDHYAFTGARIFVRSGQILDSATLIIKAGKIQAIGKNLALPKDAIHLPLDGRYLYPAFIETFASYGLPKAQAAGKKAEQYPQMLSNKTGPYAWNEALKPEIQAALMFQPDTGQAKNWRKQGFGLVLSHQDDGIARGTASLVFTGDESAHEMLLKAKAAAVLSFHKGLSTQAYPSSLMGAIALLRQTYCDAAWYAEIGHSQAYNRSLEAWNELQSLPTIFEANHRLNIFRAHKIAQEFKQNYLYKGAGDEYLRLEAIKALKAPLIVPVNFPKAYDIQNAYDAQQVSLERLKHWELAPSNPAKLAQAGIPFALTSAGLSKENDFWAQLRRAHQAGLSEEALIQALSLSPAQFLGLEKEIGSLEVGKWANFFISSSHILDENSYLEETWVKGKPYVLHSAQLPKLQGRYRLSWGDGLYQLEVKAKKSSWEAKVWSVQDSSKKHKAELSLSWPNQINLSFGLPIPDPDTSKKQTALYRFSGSVKGKQWQGKVQTAQGQSLDWQAEFIEKLSSDTLNLVKADTSSLGPVYFPAHGYGFLAEEIPQAQTVLFRKAKVWTGGKAGILDETDVLISQGKIKQIGQNLPAPQGGLVIEAQGKHLTAGIIDEHSHIAIQGGVNEGTQESSAEVSIADVLNSEDVNIYRQLAGGVTAVQLLHGSANPIGGQSALIKLRLGALPEELKIEQAPKFIKFALGENVKQSNWGDQANIRFPQTRMGVEQVYEDYFTRAKTYAENRKKLGNKERRDLDLEVVAEILQGQRFITCHSYVQSEITMLMRVAERHNFRVNTFTHILEGYKIGDKMKAHGVGASTFSDWWAYKAEVLDAIPHNAKILDDLGIVTAINSDDAEMGRRLNQEAAKSVKYANMDEAKAWNLVTLNPAKLLRLDQKIGSIEVGKDADLVLWTASPLSIRAKAEKTFVDGRCLFDLERDQNLRQRIAKERNRLIQKMAQAKTAGAKTQAPSHEHQHHYHCGDLHEDWSAFGY